MNSESGFVKIVLNKKKHPYQYLIPLVTHCEVYLRKEDIKDQLFDLEDAELARVTLLTSKNEYARKLGLLLQEQVQVYYVTLDNEVFLFYRGTRKRVEFILRKICMIDPMTTSRIVDFIKGHDLVRFIKKEFIEQTDQLGRSLSSNDCLELLKSKYKICLVERPRTIMNHWQDWADRVIEWSDWPIFYSKVLYERGAEDSIDSAIESFLKEPRGHRFIRGFRSFIDCDRESAPSRGAYPIGTLPLNVTLLRLGYLNRFFLREIYPIE